MSNTQPRGTAREDCYILPFARNRNFSGRYHELHTLIEQMLLTDNVHTMAIIGPGGTGKTQIALEFAHTVKNTMPGFSIFWIDAWSRDSFEQACADIIAALHIDQADMNEDDAKVVLRRYLSSDDTRECLIVLDNVNDRTILDHLPRGNKGMTVITTRTSEVITPPTTAATKEHVILLGSMTLDEAVEFFHKSLLRKELAQEKDTIRRLLRKLACWPLAIAQAAAYLNMNKISVLEYLQLMEDMEQGPLKHEVESCFNHTWLDKSYSKIPTTLMASFVQLQKSNEDAVDLLAFLTCIEWRVISRMLLPNMQSENRTEDAINTLCSYSLLAKYGGETPMGKSREEWYNMHPFVHSAARIWTNKFERPATTKRALNNVTNMTQRALKDATDIIGSIYLMNQAVWKAYRPHARCILRSMQSLDNETNSRLCLLRGQCLLLDENMIGAVYWLEESYRWSQSACEERDVDRLLTEYMLAIAYRDTGRIKEAIALLEHVVGVQENKLAEIHPRRLASQHALGSVYTLNGQTQKAIALFERVVAVREKVLPKHHPHRLASQRELARAYELDRQAVSMAATSVTDTVPYTLAGTTLIETDNTVASIGVPSPTLPKSNERDEDCDSVTSNNDEIGSQTGTEMRTHAELHAVNVLGNFFGELKELHALHSKLLERLGRKRFVENYRRVLKFYVLRLKGPSETRTRVEELTIRVLESRPNRYSIARKIVELLDSGDEDLRKPFDPLDCRLTTKEELARWMEGLPTVDAHDVEEGPSHIETAIRDEEGFDGIDDHGEDTDEDCDDGEKTEKPFDPQDDFDTNFTSVIDSAKEFLRRHTGILVLELRLLLLSASLREVVETVPREDIRILYTNDVTLINRIKAFVEDNTSMEWDWWPLKSRVPDLPPDRQRLEWQISGHFFYRAISTIEAAEVQSVLDEIGNHPPKCYCCAAKKSQQDTLEFFKYVSKSLMACIIEKIQNSWPVSSSTSTARLRYTPSNTPVAGISPASTNNASGTAYPQPSNVTGNVAQAQSNSANGSPTNPLQVSAWVIFGVEDGSGFNDIENIDTSCPLMNDATFFTKLKQLESKYRWYLLRWLSPYIFCYCKFVQFDTMNVDRVYCCGEHLPEDHHREAEYHPRPRVVERPPIGKQEFMKYLRTCGRYCLWSRLPFFRHRCCRPHEASRKWQKIPRKLSPFDTKVALPENVAYGLDAVYVLSFPMVFIYHTVSILAWFGFWVWWLKLHPGDLQNASIPMMVFLGIMASFWVLPGRQKDV